MTAIAWKFAVLTLQAIGLALIAWVFTVLICLL